MQVLKPLKYFPCCVLMILTSIAYAKTDKYKMKYSNMDVNQDGIITADEWRGDENIFLSSDWNGDSVLSGNEATGGFQRGEDYDRNHSEARFRKLDQNKDSGVSRNEWDGITQAFNRLDDNRNGVLTSTEFVNHRVEGTDRFTEWDLDRDGSISLTEGKGNSIKFNHLDKNNDGQLSRTEFANPLEAKKNWFRSPAPPSLPRKIN
jgi:Ca2+-binding EF-hand superfamily protein